MRSDRLLDVATVLEGVPDEKFDMQRWFDQKPCGTVGCAVGWYIEVRKPEGLSRDEDGDPITDDDGHEWGFFAAASHFGIGFRQAEYLFAASEYPSTRITRAEVIDRIRDFVASGGKVE